MLVAEILEATERLDDGRFWCVWGDRLIWLGVAAAAEYGGGASTLVGLLKGFAPGWLGLRVGGAAVKGLSVGFFELFILFLRDSFSLTEPNKEDRLLGIMLAREEGRGVRGLRVQGGL